MSETHFSRDTVDRGLWLAILSSLLCPETDRNIRIGKQGYVFYFTDFKKWCFDVSFLTSISVSTVVLTLGKVEFFKYINLGNFLFIGFFKLEIKQWFSAYQYQVCSWFSLAWLPTEAVSFLKKAGLASRNIVLNISLCVSLAVVFDFSQFYCFPMKETSQVRPCGASW